MKTVLITGGTGLIGSRLSQLLLLKGYKVTHLSRKPHSTSTIKSYSWDIQKQQIDPEAIETADYIVHLAGEGIVDKKWTSLRKKAILESRVKSAELIYSTLSKSNHKTKAFISASAIGYYGFAQPAIIFTESDKAATDFTGKTCIDWENATIPFERIMRTVKIRVGIVLSKKGGALPKLALPIQLFLGSPLGTGKQFIPWIHIDDVCNIYIKAIEDHTMQGAYNAVAPQHIKQFELTKALAHALHRPLFLPPVPAFVLKILLGERAPLVLEGNCVSCEKIMKSGFQFQYPELEKALMNIYK